MKQKSPRTTWMGIFTLISTGSSIGLLAWQNPAALFDPQVLAGAAAGIATGVGLIKAADHATVQNDVTTSKEPHVQLHAERSR